MRVYLDDIRQTPEGFDVRTYNAQLTMDLVKTGQVTYISLDNDLGEKLEGYDVAKYIEELAFNGLIPRMGWAIHSANAPARMLIQTALQNADRFWSQHEEKANVL